MSEKLYERMIRLIDYTDKMCNVCTSLGTDIHDEKLEYDSKMKYQSLISEYNNSIVETLCEFDVSKIFDEEIRNQVKYLMNDKFQEMFYTMSILKEIMDHIRFNKFGQKDAIEFIKRLYDIVSDIAEIATGIKFSDYCYVERRLLKKKDIYPELYVKKEKNNGTKSK